MLTFSREIIIMCLNTLAFNLNDLNTLSLTPPFSNGEFPTGIGYKVYNPTYSNPTVELNLWIAAKYAFYKNDDKIKISVGKVSERYNRYWPGFHIWTTLEDAIGYYRYYRWDYRGDCEPQFFKVEYRHVTGFGSNECAVRKIEAGKESWVAGYKPCVIAHEMRFLESLTPDKSDLAGIEGSSY